MKVCEDCGVVEKPGIVFFHAYLTAKDFCRKCLLAGFGIKE